MVINMKLEEITKKPRSEITKEEKEFLRTYLDEQRANKNALQTKFTGVVTDPEITNTGVPKLLTNLQSSAYSYRLILTSLMFDKDSDAGKVVNITLNKKAAEDLKEKLTAFIEAATVSTETSSIYEKYFRRF